MCGNGQARVHRFFIWCNGNAPALPIDDYLGMIYETEPCVYDVHFASSLGCPVRAPKIIQ